MHRNRFHIPRKNANMGKPEDITKKNLAKNSQNKQKKSTFAHMNPATILINPILFLILPHNGYATNIEEVRRT